MKAKELVSAIEQSLMQKDHETADLLAVRFRGSVLEEAARVASGYTAPGTKNVHPDILFEDMSETAQHVSHATAQGIATDIRALAEKEPS